MVRRIPFAIAILTIISGVFISILFGANESMFKDKIAAGLEQNIKIQAMEDPVEKAAKIKKEKDKNWRYYQRFHFHATAIGSMSMALCLFLLLITGAGKLPVVASYMVSVGGFLYPFVWLFAGIYGPEMGRHEAKEAFAIFGYMGGIFLLGSILTLVLAVHCDVKGVSDS